MKKLLLAAFAALSIGQVQAQGTFPGTGLVESTVATPTLLGSTTLNTNTTTMRVASVVTGNHCPLSYTKGTSSPTGIFGEVLNAPSGIYWEPQYSVSPVNLCEFGPVGDQSHDDTTNIQAGIDWGFSVNSTRFRLQAGKNYLISAALWLDPPSNMRSAPPGSVTNPPSGQFSVSLDGGIGPGILEGEVARIWANFSTGCILWIGPGQGNALSSVEIRGPLVVGPNVHRGLPPNGIGVCVASGNSGASRTLIENVSSYDSYTGISIGANGNTNLGDSTTIRKCNIRGAVAMSFLTSNAFINRADDCVIEASTAVLAKGNGVTVFGGNYSVPNLLGAVFTISTVSSATVLNPGAVNCGTQTHGPVIRCTGWQLTVTLTITNPDAIMTQGGVYDGFTLKTPNYGLIPLSLVSYNTTTHVAVFQVLDPYMAFYFHGADPNTTTNVLDEINALTTLYAAERNIVFIGTQIFADGIHIENGTTPTTLYQDDLSNPLPGAEGAYQNSFRDIKINGDWTNGAFAGAAVQAGSATATQTAQYYIARSWPQMFLGGAPTLLSQVSNVDPSDDMAIIDTFNPGFTNLAWQGNAPRMMWRQPINAYAFTNGTIDGLMPSGAVPPAFGGGIFDGSPFLTTANPTAADRWRGYFGMGRTPMLGVRPAPSSTPQITPVFAAQWVAGVGGSGIPAISLPANTNPLFSTPATVPYPLMYGGQIYQTSDWFIGTTTNHHLVSNHHFWSYGQMLPSIAWSYRGASGFLNVADTRLFFPGLAIAISCVGIATCPVSGPLNGLQLLMVTGVYPQLGYITVLRANEVPGGDGPWQMLGVKGTTYSGTAINSEVYTIVSTP